MSVRDIADLLNVSDKTIYRMIQSETIPCFRVGGQWRFDRKEIASWLEDTRMFFYKPARNLFSAGDEESICITELLRKGGIHYQVAGNSKRKALTACLQRLRTRIPQMDIERLFASVVQRETLCSTSIGHGIALPHPKSFGKSADFSYVALCYLQESIPFGAADNEHVDTLFFILPKSERRFLRIQSKLLRLLRDAEVMSVVKRGSSADAVYAVFAQRETEIFKGAEE